MYELQQRLNKYGFCTNTFPAEITSEMKRHISEYIFLSCQASKEIQASANINNLVMSLSDAEFIDIFSKPRRSFYEDISSLVMNWVTVTFSQIFPEKKLALSCLGKWEIKDDPKLNENSPSLYWRCVRPKKASDVGFPHRDSTFWQIAEQNGYDPNCSFEYKHRWKVWVPLIGCNGDNSLQVLPFSHKTDVPTKQVETKNGLKPTIDSDWLNKEKLNFISPLERHTDSCIIFHDDLVHTGPKNNTEHIRVSAEFTVLTD